MKVTRGPLGFFRADFCWDNRIDDEVDSPKLIWCKENLKGHYTLDLGWIRLFNEEDALAYKLRWEE